MGMEFQNPNIHLTKIRREKVLCTYQDFTQNKDIQKVQIVSMTTLDNFMYTALVNE